MRSTVAAYTGVHDELRKLYAKFLDRGFKASDLSYNTGGLRCPGCGGRVVATGTPEEIRGNPESMTGRYL